MENESNSLNSMLLKAWRERWTDFQWGIHMKKIFSGGTNRDTNHLADCIIQQAVISSDANKLFLSYLRHSLCSRQVSYAAVLLRVSKFEGFDRPYCLIALLSFLDTIIDGTTCRGKIEEAILPKSMMSIIDWLTNIFSKILETHFIHNTIDPQHQKILNLMVGLSSKIFNNSFLMSILYISKQEDNECYQHMLKKFSDLNNILNNSQFKHFYQAKEFEELLRKILLDNNIMNKSMTEEDIEPITYCLQPLIAIEVQKNTCQSTDEYVKRLLTIRQLKTYPLFRFYYEIIRASLISLNNVSGTNRESNWCAFTFIKIPQIIKHIHSELSHGTDQSESLTDVTNAIEMLVEDPILDFLDTKSGCNTIEFLINELLKQNLINEDKSKELILARDSILLPLSKVDLTGQQPSVIKVVKQASSPLNGILKALDGDYNKMQEALLGLLSKTLSGTSFDLILLVATAEGKLKTFVSRLIRCNESSKQVAGEVDKPAAIRAALFDVSFLMLTFIVQTYGSEALSSDSGDSFFENWVRDCMFENDKTKSPMSMVHQSDQSIIDEFLVSISGEAGQTKTTLTLRWQEACMNIPALLHQILIAWENKIVSMAEIQVFLDNLKTKLCCFSVCAASWLRLYMETLRQDEQIKPMSMMKELLSTNSSTDDSNQQENFKERLSLTQQIIRKIQTDINQNQKACIIGHGIISQQPLEEQFVETWKTVLENGWLTIECAQIFENLYQSCGPFWLVSKLVNEILHCKFSKDMRKYADIVFAIMHLNIEKCSVALLSDLLPMLLINKTQKFELIEPQLSALTRLCVYCIYSSLRKQNISKKRSIHSVDLNENRVAKLRKLDESNASVSLSTPFEQTKPNLPISEPFLSALQSLFNMFTMITVSDELTPKLFFVQRFFKMLLKCDSMYIQPVLALIPHNLTQNLIKYMKTTNLDYSFFLRIYDLARETERKSALSDIALFRSRQLQNID